MDTRVYKIDIQFWAVWAVGAAEKKSADAISTYDTFEVILFSWPKKLFENILASSQVTKNKGEKKFRKF